jgi:hypothetical protein
MRIRTFLVIALLSVPLFAGQTKIYPAYETARQALLNASMPQIQVSAKQLAFVARTEKQEAIAAKADALSAAKDVASARSAFAALSDEVIRFRASGAGDRPIVVYCSMEKKSWLQPKGAIANPYVAPTMRTCGEVRAQ